MELTLIVTSVIADNSGKIFLMKRANKTFHGLWWLPGGKVEKWESIEDANLREHREELGITLKEVQFLKFFQLFHPADALVFVYTGKVDEDMRIDSWEALEYWWFSKDEIQDLELAPNHREVIEYYFRSLQ